MVRISRTKQQSQQLDRKLREIVQQYIQLPNHSINWKHISQKLFQKYHIKLNNKQCSQRYKNYSSKIDQIMPELTPDQEEEIFMRHSFGQNGQKIRKQMGLFQMYFFFLGRTENNLKNTLKRPKERLGRILKKILQYNFSKIDFGSEKFPPKDQFRVLIILFSTGPLLQYYFEKGIRILQFRDKALKYDRLDGELSKKSMMERSNEKQRGQKLNQRDILKSQILRDLEIIFEKYESVYNDPILRKELIGLRQFKHSKEKYVYVRAIILNIPLKVCRDFLQINQSNSFHEENENHSRSIQKNHDIQNINDWEFQKYCLFDNQFFDIPSIKETLPLISSSKKLPSSWTIDEEDIQPKFLFLNEECHREADNYFEM